jgi:hypothetical protein
VLVAGEWIKAAWRCSGLLPWRGIYWGSFSGMSFLRTWKVVLCVYDTYLRGRSGGNINAVVGLDALCPTLLVAGRVDSCM